MSQFWPHTPYAEDQPFSHSILTTHVLTRAIQAGSLVGAGAAVDLTILRRFVPSYLPSALKAKAGIPPPTFSGLLLRCSGVGVVAATALLAVALPVKMWGREEIEWKDRSWRLLENKGQMACDNWTYPGMAAGLLGVMGSASGRAMGWRGALGGAGLGSVVGMMGYLGWTYGVKRESLNEESNGRKET